MALTAQMENLHCDTYSVDSKSALCPIAHSSIICTAAHTVQMQNLRFDTDAESAEWAVHTDAKSAM